MKKRYGLFINFVILLMILSGCDRKMLEVNVQINGENKDFVPYMSKLSNDKDGSYLDGTANQLPCLLVNNGDKISLIVKTNHEEEYTVKKCEILDANKSLGSSEAKSEFKIINIEEDNMISFDIDEIDVKQQLIVCEVKEKGKSVYQIVFLIGQVI